MNQKLKLVLMVGAVSFMCLKPLYALQEKMLLDNGEANAEVSTLGRTAIAVQNDRINDLRGESGLYTVTTDKVQGIFYVKVLPTVTHPFTVFVATENGHHYVLHLHPTKRQPDVIAIHSSLNVDPKTVQWENETPYTTVLTTLIQAMVNQTTLEDYVTYRIQKAKIQSVGNQARVQLFALYNGAHLQGQIFQVTNSTQAPISLSESWFYREGDRAIALSEHHVLPHESVFLYKVVSL